jgi:hypothetical protein
LFGRDRNEIDFAREDGGVIGICCIRPQESKARRDREEHMEIPRISSIAAGDIM